MINRILRHSWLLVVCLWFVAAVPVAAQAVAEVDSLEGSWAEMYRFFDEPVDPKTYLIRPGEELLVTFLQAKLGPLTLTVDPQGRIVHPTLGLFDLSHKSLAEARTLLEGALENLYKVEQIEISVLKPQRTAVQVSGAVTRPGMYKGFTSHRVSEIIEQAGGIAWHGSTRQIEFTGGPRPLIIDLDKVRYLGDNSSNPCLYAGYSIHVPSKSALRVQVVGEVNRPREIELVPGDGVSTLIALAGGFRAGADVSQVSISRGADVVITPDEGVLPPLQQGDIITVPARERTHDQEMLKLFGAVSAPGMYAFSTGLTLESLVGKAGGFTQEASRGMVTLFRKAGADEWGRISERRYPITSAVGADGNILAMTLRAGDSVYVPFQVGYVNVTGEVLNPGRYPFIDNKDALFYVMTAGGFLPRANTEEISIYNRIAKTTAEFSTGVMVHDGDELIINLREELR
ncbi:MAG: SLBB domain-containing protein [candidate division Zixibacteria bacterium]|nr:SLBB domain-containing protein [candidate division Zixibacteria bacterium]MDH3937685.1 SLBB domain-containing protein [candidate division Zixibacteria bacterium]MDH4032322.1 SLBB domain-containing protein [candidate division Zixibacteria bacterium]